MRDYPRRVSIPLEEQSIVYIEGLDRSVWISGQELAEYAENRHKPVSTCACTCTCQSEVKDDLASLVAHAVSLVQTYLILGEDRGHTPDQVNVALQVLRMATIEDAE